jgi:hypothetical protein
MAYPVEAVDHLLQCREKHAPVLVVLENSFAPVTTRGDVVKSIGKL